MIQQPQEKIKYVKGRYIYKQNIIQIFQNVQLSTYSAMYDAMYDCRIFLID